MKMIKLTLALVAVGALASFTGCKEGETHQGTDAAMKDHAVQYTCSMHPEVVQDKPGKCSKCGMALVEKH